MKHKTIENRFEELLEHILTDENIKKIVGDCHADVFIYNKTEKEALGRFNENLKKLLEKYKDNFKK